MDIQHTACAPERRKEYGGPLVPDVAAEFTPQKEGIKRRQAAQAGGLRDHMPGALKLDGVSTPIVREAPDGQRLSRGKSPSL